MIENNIKRLQQLAASDLADYDRQIRAGGEPAFPRWTSDLRAVLDQLNSYRRESTTAATRSGASAQ